MRTTLDLDEKVLRAARTLAAERRVSLGAAVSELALRGLRDRPAVDDDGIPMFDVPRDAAPLTPEMVRDAVEDW